MPLYIRHITSYIIDEGLFNIKFINDQGTIYKNQDLNLEFGIYSHTAYDSSKNKNELYNQLFVFNYVSIDNKETENQIINYKNINKTTELTVWNKLDTLFCEILDKNVSKSDNTLKTFRWLTGLSFDIDKKGSSLPLAMSIDKINWIDINWDFEPKFIVKGILGDEITKIVDDKLFNDLIVPHLHRSEPISHDLLYEAKKLLNNRNVRSSFILGFTALEIGVKEYLQVKVPDTSWLLQESPSPDIFKICNKYIPTIDKELTLESYEKKLIEVYMKNRNKLIHRGIFEENMGSVIKKLYMVEYMLHRFDYSNGLERAKQYAEKAKEGMIFSGLEG